MQGTILRERGNAPRKGAVQCPHRHHTHLVRTCLCYSHKMKVSCRQQIHTRTRDPEKRYTAHTDLWLISMNCKCHICLAVQITSSTAEGYGRPSATVTYQQCTICSRTFGGAFNAHMRSPSSKYRQGTDCKAQLGCWTSSTVTATSCSSCRDVSSSGVGARSVKALWKLWVLLLDAVCNRCLILPVVKVPLNEPCGTPSRRRV